MNILAIILLAASVNIPDDPTIRQLVSTGGPQAERTLAAALPKADDTRAVAIIKALGDLGSSEPVRECARRLVNNAKGDMKDVCLYALSRTTSRRAARFLRSRISDEVFATAYLRHGESLVEIGRKTEPAEVALDLMRAKSPAVRCGAVALLASVRGYSAQPTLLAMLDDPDRSVREQVVRQLARMPSAVGLIAAAGVAKGQRRLHLLDAVGRRADPAHAALMIECLRDNDEAVRQVAVSALRNISGSQVDAEIAKALASPVSQATALELLAARRARSQVAAVMPLINSPASKQAFAALGALAGPGEVEQLIALASKDEKVRDDATKAIAVAAPRIADNARCVAALAKVPSWGLALLPAFGGKAALDAVVAATNGNDREAAVRALADWRDESALEPLIVLCRDASEEKLRVLSARGAIRIVQQSSMEKTEKASWLKKVMEASPRATEKQQAQAALDQLDKKPTAKKKK